MLTTIYRLNRNGVGKVNYMSPRVDLIEKISDKRGNLCAGVVCGDHLYERTHRRARDKALDRLIGASVNKWGRDAVTSNPNVQSHAGNSFW